MGPASPSTRTCITCIERARLRFASLGLDDKFIQADLFEFTRELRRIAQRTGFGVCNTYNTGFAAGVDGCLLQPLTGKSMGWQDGPAWANALNGWVVNLVAKAA